MPQKSKQLVVLAVLILLPLLFLRFPSQISSPLRMWVLGWFKPAYQLVHTVTTGSGQIWNGIFEGIELKEKNQLLQSQLDALMAHEETHRLLFEENERLRELLDFSGQSPWDLIPCEVVGRNLGPWSSSLILDKGTRAGVEKGMAVITPVGLVGRISEVGPDAARVMLMTDTRFRVTGLLAQQKLVGLVRGAGAGQLALTYLPVDVAVEVGELVMTSGGRSFCPEGIPIAHVFRLEKDQNTLYQTLRLRPAADLSRLGEVLVVRWGHSEHS